MVFIRFLFFFSLELIAYKSYSSTLEEIEIPEKENKNNYQLSNSSQSKKRKINTVHNGNDFLEKSSFNRNVPLPLPCPTGLNLEEDDIFWKGQNDLEKIIEGSENLDDVTIIWDFHGVLTLDANPDNKSIVRPNEEVIDLYNKAYKKGASNFIVSAHPDIKEIINGVKTLNLLDKTRLDKYELHKGEVIFDNRTIYYERQGHVISARWKNDHQQYPKTPRKKNKLAKLTKSEDKDFKDKALVLRCDILKDNTERIFFIEDNKNNLKRSRKQIESNPGNAQVGYFLIESSF